MQYARFMIGMLSLAVGCLNPPEHVPVDPLADAGDPRDSGADLTAPDTASGRDADRRDQAGACDECRDDQVCEPATGECAECFVDADCASGACEPLTRTCVECLESTSCIGATGSRCAPNFTCQPCEDSLDCAHISGRNVCVDGVCVECDAGDTSACGARACNPRANLCTQIEAGSLGSCAACETDSECAAGSFCVVTQFGDQTLHGGETGYCLVEYVGQPCPQTTRWRQQYTGVPSLDDPTLRNFCAPVHTLTTCPAVLEWGKPCASADECGLGLGDARCLPTEGAADPTCTWPCDVGQDCPAGVVCGDGEKVCGRL